MIGAIRWFSGSQPGWITGCQGALEPFFFYFKQFFFVYFRLLFSGVK